MDAVFFVLLWIASPSGGYSDFYGSLSECRETRENVTARPDTLYVSECTEIKMKFIKSVKQDYQRPSEVAPWVR